MVQRPKWLRIHQQVSEERREGEERVSPRWPVGLDTLPSSSPPLLAEAHGCNVQLVLVESL